MRKILLSLMTLVLVVGMIGGGAFAYFSDTETSEDNTFTAGTLDMQLSNNPSWGDGVTATWVSPANWAPGDTVEATLHIKNIGSIGSVNVFLKPTELVEIDNLTPESEPTSSPNNIADWINVTNFQITFVDTTSTTPFLTYGNWAGDAGWMSQSPYSPWSSAPPLTLREFHNTSYKVWIFGSSRSDDALEANGADTIELTMTFEFEPTAPNDYQGDQCTMTFRVLTFNGPVEGGVIIWESGSPPGYGYASLE